MLKIPVVKGNLNKALKQFKVKFKKTGVLKELKERKNYTKPSLKRRIQKDEAIRKLKKQQEDE
jgi:small subunit ribosomal protein S21|tara:strand:- start:540 stop:728 length:189 start_codon:yes stop_codon:yes gene_type:complete